MHSRFLQRRFWFVACLIGTSATALYAEPRGIWKINVDGTGLARFAGAPGYRCGSPDWSPDGKYVAYDTWPETDPGGTHAVQIAIVRADGSDLHLIGHGAMPSWSPDGKQLVCHTYDNPQTCVVMNADGSGRETVLTHWGSPRWSLKGNRIASLLNGNIAIYELATAKERPILSDLYSANYGFSISPNGRQFCFGNTSSDLCLATLDEQTMKANVRTLVQGGTYHHSSFAPDGKRVVFSRPPAGAKCSQLHVVDVDGNAVPQLLPGQDATRINCEPDWSPDGKTIVFASEAADP